PMAPVDPCTAGAGYTFLSIIDFEPAQPGRFTSARCNTAIANCSTYFNWDTANTHDKLVECDPDQPFSSNYDAPTSGIKTGEIPGTRCGTSTGAATFVTTNLAACTNPTTGRIGWGAAFDIDFSSSGFDATPWDGVSFWVQRRASRPLGDNRRDN